jgi:diguanylate cyclase (GGDEF)-like protein/PAS domain S-box-containing protein
MKLTAVGTGVHNAQRLAGLHRLGLLDSPAEPAFDRLTKLVIRLLDVPAALVSLVDADRQFFKSSVGLPEPWASQRETPLSYSFCQFVVETGEPFVVADALRHPLVCANLAISDMNVHAYLGIPLITSEGMVLGSLCAIDNVPRTWAAEDIALVQDLAAAVMTEIELRRDIKARRQAEAALYESNARFAGAFTHASIGMALVATDGRWLQVNRALCDLVGYSEQELLASTFQQLTHPDDLDTDLAYVQQMLRGEISAYQMEKRYLHKDGHILWVLLNVSLVRDLAGVPQYFVSQLQDGTQRRQREWERQHLIDQLGEALDERTTLLQQSDESLRRTEALYQVAEALNHTQEMDLILRTVVERASTVLPADRTVLITVDIEAKTVRQQLEGGPGARHVAALTFAELEEGLSGIVLRERQPVLSPKGVADSRESLAVQQRRVRDEAGSILVVPVQSQGSIFGTLTAINAPHGVDFSTRDMALLAALANQAAIAIERAMLLSELQHRATTDELTRLLNRRSWFEQSQRSVALAERTGRPISVVLVDADHFKHVNDTYGHSVGDAVLETISCVVRQAVRRSDIVGRYGGEEFVILLPDADAEAALYVAERVRETVAGQAIIIQQAHLALTVSLGIASSQGESLDLTTLLKHADGALYAAKHAGRNCIRVYAI